ncbi:MAG: YkgJ family cysteine cluster protein [Deltaproteobacteria bacterium]|nr:YkgJ family cysteine cluster protein [Deltaproteobacteria bacterium]MBN2674208.1 YkgJ family cysteine cluster protein [Deltaproteobacteria bacterium]
MKTRLSDEILKIYNEFDAASDALATQFGIHCPPGCGSCCASPKVEATVLEMIPLAEWLIHAPEAREYLLYFENEELPPHCAFYTPDTLHFNHGRCSVYPHRPTLCRLFGFAAVRDKREKPVFAACKFIKQMVPNAVSAVQAYADEGNDILLFTEAAARVAALEPSLDRRYPINEALKHALEKVGMRLYLESLEQNEQPDPQLDPSTPPDMRNCS